MKTNKIMRIASVLLVAVLLSTCVISGTFAKYVTTTEAGTSSARVAAWGFGSATTISFDLFDPTYTNVNGGTDDVIAPGTDGSSKVTLNYAATNGKAAPEVAYTVTLAVDNSATSIGENIKNNGNIQWQFNEEGWGKWDDMIADINAYTEDVEAGALPTLTDTNIQWRWLFDNDPADGANDVKDTALGDAATLETVTLAIKLTATQKD
jgi:hypothetical protein